MEWFDKLVEDSSSLDSILLNLVLAFLLAQILTWHYLRYAEVLSNKRKFARMFVFISATTMLIITVVKTSLALSLGLVGALSIIRFRTPIKEPEELAYLFLSIAVGVGLGAGETAATAVVFAAILIFLTIRSGVTKGGTPQRTVLQVSAPLAESDDPGAEHLKLLLPAVSALCSKVDLRRVDCGSGEFNASLFVELSSSMNVADLISRVQNAVSGATVSIIEWEGLE